MFCVTTAAIKGLAPHPLDTKEPEQQQANRAYLENWLDRFVTSRLSEVNKPTERSCQLFVTPMDV